MSDLFRFAQLQPYSLYGAGAVAGATSITLKSMTDIDGNALSMAGTFGSIGFGTMEPGNGNLEEQISFTGLVNNTNGTVTLSGVSNVTFTYPYTQTSGLFKTHAGSTSFVISNTSGFYDELTSKADDETVTGTWTFPTNDPTRAGIGSDVDTAVATAFVTLGQLSRQAISGASNAATTVKGIVQLSTQAQADAKTTVGSTGALLVNTPELQRSTLLSDYVIDTGAADAYVITPVPAIAAYAVGQIFTFKSIHANTTTSTLNVNGKGATTIKKNGGANNLVAGDILLGQIVQVEYDGTNFQLVNPIATQPITQNSKEVYAADSVGTDAYAITLVPAISAYVIGQTFYFKAGTANTGAATLAVNGLTATAIVKKQATALNTGDILANQIVQVVYDGTNFQMLSPQSLPFYGLAASGATTYDLSTTSGAQNIPHGLGVTPKLFKVFCAYALSSTSFSFGESLSGNSLSFQGVTGGTVGTISTTLKIWTGNDQTQQQSGVVTADATNIIITWTKSGTPTGTLQIVWDAMA